LKKISEISILSEISVIGGTQLKRMALLPLELQHGTMVFILTAIILEVVTALYLPLVEQKRNKNAKPQHFAILANKKTAVWFIIPCLLCL